MEWTPICIRMVNILFPLFFSWTSERKKTSLKCWHTNIKKPDMGSTGCSTRWFRVPSLVFGDYFDLLRSDQSNQADPAACSSTGSGTACISHLSADLVYPLLQSLNAMFCDFKFFFPINWARDTNCAWAEKRDRISGLFVLYCVNIGAGLDYCPLNASFGI